VGANTAHLGREYRCYFCFVGWSSTTDVCKWQSSVWCDI